MPATDWSPVSLTTAASSAVTVPATVATEESTYDLRDASLALTGSDAGSTGIDEKVLMPATVCAPVSLTLAASRLSTYVLRVSWLPVVGSEAGPTGMLENVLTPATVCAPVSLTFAASSPSTYCFVAAPRAALGSALRMSGPVMVEPAISTASDRLSAEPAELPLILAAWMILASAGFDRSVAPFLTTTYPRSTASCRLGFRTNASPPTAATARSRVL